MLNNGTILEILEYLYGKRCKEDLRLSADDVRELYNLKNFFDSIEFNNELDPNDMLKKLNDFEKNELAKKLFGKNIEDAKGKTMKMINGMEEYNIAQIMYSLNNNIFKLQELL